MTQHTQPPAGPAVRLTVWLGEDDRHGHHALYTEVVHRAHLAGLAGASVFRGVEGFGADSRIHTARLLSLTEDLPVAVVVIDTADRVEGFLPDLLDLVGDALVTVEDVRVVRR